ncbi:MAG TPA: hypothetical protein PKV71_18530, partial [Calditrichia bacterium]|nr:hypothetical protein [Calditrichia bacterium]
MKWTIQRKMIAVLVIMVVLMTGQQLLMNGMLSHNVELTEFARDKGYKGADLVRRLELNVVQVQQWLTDISATRAAEGFDDGFDEAEHYAREFSTNLQNLEAIYPEESARFKDLSAAFAAFYAGGKDMAQQYIDGGPEAGNHAMEKFDATAEMFSEKMGELVKKMEGEAEAAIARAMDQNLSSRLYSWIFAILTIAIGSVFLLFISRQISTGIAGSDRLAARIAEGDLSDQFGGSRSIDTRFADESTTLAASLR